MCPWEKGRPADMALAGPGMLSRLGSFAYLLRGWPRSGPTTAEPRSLLPAQVLTNSPPLLT